MNEKNPIVISVQDVQKKFRVYYDKGATLKERILFRKRNAYEDRWVLKGIDFQVKKGEAVGLIGHNGCGKSTLLKLMTRIMYPDRGTIKMEGRVSSLIELGAGFHPDMSGRENIYINASIFGLTKKEIDARLDDIIRFSELEEFIDNPVRTYSSGMYMRLAFAVAINVNADILLIDEILAVGDAAFQAKCFSKLREIKAGGATIVIVSHSMGQIEQFCDRTIWIDDGKIRMEGAPTDVHPCYMEYMSSNLHDVQSVMEQVAKEEAKRWGNGLARVQEMELIGESGEDQRTFHTGEKMDIHIHYACKQRLPDSVIGFGIFRIDNVNVYGTNTLIDHVGEVTLLEKGTAVCHISKLNLVAGEYIVDLALHAPDGLPYDFWKDVCRIKVVSPLQEVGIAHLDHEWKIEGK